MSVACRALNNVPIHIGDVDSLHITIVQLDRGLCAPSEDVLKLLQAINDRQKGIKGQLCLLPKQQLLLEKQQCSILSRSLYSGPVKRVVLVGKLVAQLSASSGYAARCAAHSLRLHTEANALVFMVQMPCWTHQQADQTEYSEIRRYGIISTAPEQLKSGQPLATEIYLLEQHLMQKGYSASLASSCQQTTADTRTARVLELVGWAILTRKCKREDASILLMASPRLFLQFERFLSARGCGSGTLELHAKAGIAVMRFLQDCSIVQHQEGLQKMEAWYSSRRKLHCKEGATIKAAGAPNLPHAGQLIEHIYKRVEQAQLAVKHDPSFQAGMVVQSAILLSLLGFAYAPPVRSEAIRTLLFPTPRVMDATAMMKQLGEEYSRLNTVGGSAGQAEKQRILSLAWKCRTCSDATCTDAFCLGNRVEVVYERRRRRVIYKLVHFKNSEALGEQEICHKDAKLQQLELLWVDQLHDMMAPGCQTMFFNTAGSPFPKSACFSTFLKNKCWDIQGVNTCARDIRGIFVTSLRDFAATQQQVEVSAIMSTLASLMMTSLKKWDSHYDRHKRLRKEQEALRLHARYTATMLQDWRSLDLEKHQEPTTAKITLLLAVFFVLGLCLLYLFMW